MRIDAMLDYAAGYSPSDALIAELQKHVQLATAPYKYPRQIAFVDSLPKSEPGKVLRRVLRDREAGSVTKVR